MNLACFYTKVIYWSDEDDCYVVEVPELTGCFSDGKTEQEALSNVKSVIQEWLEVAEQEHIPIPQPRQYSRTQLFQSV